MESVKLLKLMILVELVNQVIIVTPVRSVNPANIV